MNKQETTAPESTKPAQSLDEQAVADYLRRHPHFFENKPTLLADLRIPHTTGSAVSLVERQVAVLRDSNTGLQDQLQSLIQVARENDRLNGLLQKLTLRLIECGNLGDLLALIDIRLRQDFSADRVTVQLLSTPKDGALATRPEFVRDADALRGLFQRLLGAGKPYCGQLKAEQLEALFGEQAAEVGSAALMPLSRRNGGGQGELGLIAIGSFERRRFHSAVDTAFLGRMSEIIAATLQGYLRADD